MKKFVPGLAAVALALAMAIAGVVEAADSVVVYYAGSLVTPMEGPLKTALAQRGIAFEGQGAGSKMLANLIASGVKNPDVFISVDPKLVTGLGDKVDHATTFAATSLGIGWSSASKDAALFSSVAAGKTTLLAALETPGLAIGRTDPKLDPKGAYTVEAVKIFAGDAETRILGDPENNAQIFPEEDLLARIDTGQADVGFFYKTEAVARGLNFIPMPGAAAMSDKITYTLAVMKAAPHPAQAKAFEDFVLTGDGKTILVKAGIDYLDPPRPLPAAK